jgi:hypothetical protein
LDEAFGFTVGAWGVGAGKEMAQAVALTSGAEEMGTIAGAVVAHEPLRLDAQRGEVSQGPLKEEHGTLLSLIGHDLREGDPRSVVDADMDELPARSPDLIAPIVSDAVTGAHDSSQLFDIEVEQLTRELALVTHNWQRWRQSARPGEAMATQ